MLKKSVISVCLCGMMWAGICQAGFLGNNSDLKFLKDINNVGDTTAIATDRTKATQGNGNVVDNPQTQSVDSQKHPGDLSLISDTQSVQVAAAVSVPEPGTFYLIAMGLMVMGMLVYVRKRRVKPVRR